MSFKQTHPWRREWGPKPVPMKMPRSRCRVAAACDLCEMRIKPGMWMGLDFTSKTWCHIGCLIRKINATKAAAE